MNAHIALTLVALAAACSADRKPAADEERVLRTPAARVEAAPAAPDTTPARQVAVTFDDLPVIGPRTLEQARAVTDKLLGHIEAAGMPAIGFVNEQKLQIPGQMAERTALLEQWLEAGLDLGNHTYSHRSLYRTPIKEFEEDVLRGERVTKRLLAAHGSEMRYFRHPFLNTGPDLETKERFERFLAEHGYAIAPVTIDNDEWIYAAAYANALQRGDSAMMRRTGADYVRYMEESFAFYEAMSRDLLGREPPQVLLLHANFLNADYLDELTAMMRGRGYGFITLDEALEEPAYDLPDRYAGRSGLSWLQRWAITQGRDPGEHPEVPEWVGEAAER